MRIIHGGAAVRAAALAVAAVLATSAGADDAKDDEATPAKVLEKFREVDRDLRVAEETLARSLAPQGTPGGAREATAEAAQSLTKLLDAMRGQGEGASAGIQWILDHAPQ